MFRAGGATVEAVVAFGTSSWLWLPGSGAGVPDGPVRGDHGLLAPVFLVRDDGPVLPLRASFSKRDRLILAVAPR